MLHLRGSGQVQPLHVVKFSDVVGPIVVVAVGGMARDVDVSAGNFRDDRGVGFPIRTARFAQDEDISNRDA